MLLKWSQGCYIEHSVMIIQASSLHAALPSPEHADSHHMMLVTAMTTTITATITTNNSSSVVNINNNKSLIKVDRCLDSCGMIVWCECIRYSDVAVPF